ncbi:MAG TPA: Trp family transcriptional regulator [Patescibacteria group bacterium]|nr:Trp family transcriptional regulator [Patescibacteria group bacterium]
MTQVSKYPMHPDLERRMFDIFYQTIAELKSKDQVRIFLYDLLSPTERTMLSKRLAIATLLLKGNSYDMIRSTLKVSTSTIVTIKRWLDEEGRGYKKAIEKLLRKESVEAFADKVEEIIEKVIIPRPGINWSSERSNSWHKRAKRRRESTL